MIFKLVGTEGIGAWMLGFLGNELEIWTALPRPNETATCQLRS